MIREKAGGVGTARGLALVGAALVAAVAFAGMAAPLVLRALRAAGAAEASLDEVTVRTLELVAVALTFPLLAALGTGGRDAWGVPRRARLGPRVAAGFALGAASLGLVCALLLAFGARGVLPNVSVEPTFWLRVVLSAALSAAAVAVLEEYFFRGGLYAVFERLGGPVAAIGVPSVIYAAAHFLEAPGVAAGGGAGAGFEALAACFAAIWRVENVDSMAALLVFGALLGLARLRTGDVATCIGIHAGAVFVIKVYKKATYADPQAPLRALAGHYDDVIGWLATLVLALLALALWCRLGRVGEGAGA